MTRGTLAGLGLCLSALLLGLPLAHLERVELLEPELSTLVYVLALLPLPLLVAGVYSLRMEFTIFLFPISHLPALVLEPRLMGELVYSGTEGLLAQGLVWVAFGLWTGAALRAHPAGSGPARAVSWSEERADGGILLFYPLAILAVFVVEALATPSPGTSGTGHAQVTILSGWLVAAWVGGRWIYGDLVRLHLDTEKKRRGFAELLVVRRFSPSIFWTFSGVAVALGSLLALVYGVRS